MLTATFRIEHEALALEEAFREVSDLVVEVQCIAAHSTRWTMPCLWLIHEEPDTVEDAFDQDQTVAEIVRAEDIGNRRYLQIAWSDAVVDRIDSYTDQEGAILEATATHSGWRLNIQFATRDQLGEFQERMAEQGHPFELITLSDSEHPSHSIAELTPRQTDVLAVAHEAGYFKIPREVTARELASDLDMSHQALSELLRRATDNLVRHSLSTTASATMDSPNRSI